MSSTASHSEVLNGSACEIAEIASSPNSLYSENATGFPHATIAAATCCSASTVAP